MKKKFWLTFNLLFIVILGLFAPIAIFGIAMVSEAITISDATRGSEITKELLLINSESQNVTYQIKAEGEIAGWMTFYSSDDKDMKSAINEISINAESRKEATVKFIIPGDIRNGTYKGSILIMQSVAAGGVGNVSTNVNLVVDREVKITVTDKENIKLDAEIIPLEYDVVRGRLLQFKIIYNNKGNVSLKPEINLKIVNPNGGEVFHNAVYPYPDNTGAVRPYERKDMGSILEWSSADRQEGVYEAQIKILVDNNEMVEKKVTFSIIKEGANSFLGANLSDVFNGRFGQFWIAAGMILIVTAATLQFINKRRNWLAKVGHKE